VFLDNKDIQKQETAKNTETSSYRSIFKATSLFGGVQAYQILIEIVKSKVIALLLGPMGVGISGLYMSATGLIQNFTSFGLSSSAVRNVSEANNSGDTKQIARVVFALRRLVWITGLLGMIVVILTSPILSKTSFGDYNHIIPFIVLSVTLLLIQINAGKRVILQGTRRLKDLAKSSTIGITVGFCIAVPLYYLLGVKGIVPNIVISSVVTLLITWWFARKVSIEKVSLNTKEVFGIGKSMLIMGAAMSLSMVLASLSSYVLLASIRLWGGVEIVGLFTAGYILMTNYTGLVFNAMGTDYYPRLAAVNQDNEKCRVLMNQQGVIGFLLIAPLLVMCVIYIPIVVRILYSEKFLPINGYIVWCSLGMMFKMASWAIAFVFIAKAESKLYMINEFTVAVYTLLFNLLGFKLGGLSGLGISFTVSYFLYMIQVFVIAKMKYGFYFESQLIYIFISQFILIICSMMVAFFLTTYWKYMLGSLIMLFSCYYSFKELNKRMDLVNVIKLKLNVGRKKE